MNNTLPISIVIPALNEEKYIDDLLTSIDNQTYKPAEVIVAISPKTVDKTRDICQKHNVKIVDGGRVSCGRNRGAEAATQELIYFLDADFVFPKDSTLLLFYSLFINNDLDVATTFYCKDEKTRSLIEKSAVNGLNASKKISSILKTYTSDLANGGNLLIKKRAFEDVGGYDENLTHFEDNDFFRRVLKKKYKYKILPVVITLCTRRYKHMTRLLVAGMIALPALTIASMFLRKGSREKIINFAGKIYGPLGGHNFKK